MLLDRPGHVAEPAAAVVLTPRHLRVGPVHLDAPRGVGTMIVTCATWATTFVAPELLPGVGALVIAGSRYVLFGLIATALFLRARRPDVVVPWGRAAAYAIAGYVGYYVLAVLAVQLAGAALTVALVGMTPVLYALIGARGDGLRRRDLLGPMGILVTGLLVVHGHELLHGDLGAGGVRATVLGGLVALASMAIWIWFGLSNAAFLRSRPDLPSATWTAAIGVAAGVLAVPVLAIGLLLQGEIVPSSVPAWQFLAVIGFLALIPTLVGARGWNRASLLLSNTLQGQLLVLEVVFALTYAHLWARQAPAPIVAVGYALLVAGAVLALRPRQRHGAAAGDRVRG